jgi:hypothetical protein
MLGGGLCPGRRRWAGRAAPRDPAAWFAGAGQLARCRTRGQSPDTLAGAERSCRMCAALMRQLFSTRCVGAAKEPPDQLHLEQVLYSALGSQALGWLCSHCCFTLMLQSVVSLCCISVEEGRQIVALCFEARSEVLAMGIGHRAALTWVVCGLLFAASRSTWHAFALGSDGGCGSCGTGWAGHPVRFPGQSPTLRVAGLP